MADTPVTATASTPEPVMIGTAVVGAVPIIITALSAFHIVTLTAAQTASAVAVVGLLVTLVAALVVRGRVIPVSSLPAAAVAIGGVHVITAAPVTPVPTQPYQGAHEAAPPASPPMRAAVEPAPSAPVEPTPIADSVTAPMPAAPVPTVPVPAVPVAAPVGATPAPAGPVTAAPDLGDEHAPVLEVPPVPADDPALAPVVDPAHDALPSQLTPDELAHATQRSISGGAA